MRILCLHGVGSSGAICERQFAPLIRAADPSYEFVFVDGPVESARGPGMEAYGPDSVYYSHTQDYTPKQMAEALDHLDGTIDELGPFDGVIGFSQGAALAASYLYEQQRRGEPSPFNFFLCFSPVLTVSPDEDCGKSVIMRLRSRNLDLGTVASAGTSGLGVTPGEEAFLKMITNILMPARAHKAMLPDFDPVVYTRAAGHTGDEDGGGSGGDEDDAGHAPRIMIPEIVDQRIRIPTVYMTGRRDAKFMLDMSSKTLGLIDERFTKKLEHSGGHSPPQDAAGVRAAVSAMEWAIVQSRKMALI